MSDDSESKSRHKYADYSAVTALLTLVVCNLLIFLSAIWAAIGMTFMINPHVQAVLICLFAILTSILIYQGFRRQRQIDPLILALIGVR